MLAKKGDEYAIEQIIKEYKWIVYYESRIFFNVEKEDLLQEGLIGLYNAINDYDESKNSSFVNFATLCVSRKMISYIKMRNRKKRSVINNSVSIYQPLNDDSKLILINLIRDLNSDDPYTVLRSKEKLNDLESFLLSKLSEVEFKSYWLFLNGYSYKEIAVELNINEKSIDNALHRARKKLDNFKNEIALILSDE